MQEVNNLKHEVVSDKRIKHLIDADEVPTLDQKLYFRDLMGNIGVRVNYKRDNYKVPPGLYKIGKPTDSSEVIVTCNYKLTVDVVRSTVKQDYWLLIIDTEGVNVWCAAGKGKFGTAEVIYSVLKHQLDQKVSHKRIILPQLSGPGIQSHIIKDKTGFNVKFGPVHVKDLDAYVEGGLTCDETMRQVTFTLKERIAVMPLEWVATGKLLIITWLLVLLLPVLDMNHFWLMLFSSLIGTVFVPIILPWRPFKMFYMNGLVCGVIMSALFISYVGYDLLMVGWAILGTTLAGYQALNFTGSTTFTSLSGVKKEMEKAIPVLLTLVGIGGLTTLVGLLMEVF